MLRLIKHLLLAVTYGIITSIFIAIAAYVFILEQRIDLKPWHQAPQDSEFRAGMADSITSLDDYRKLEDKLFQHLNERVYQHPESVDYPSISRYRAGGSMDPQRFPVNWNRTFEFSSDHPKAGVLLLHGLSDSPYSMKSLGTTLHRHNYWTVGLRIPGHGTAPSGLLDVSWRDFTAAVRIAAKHLRNKIGPDRPLYLIGYSNGAALAVEYSLAVLEGEDLPRADALVLLSPAIDVLPIAGYAIWQTRLAKLIGMEKMLWSDIQPEFDPYKYNSFTVNAGDQIYRLTQNIAARMAKLSTTEGVKGFPRTLAFVSVVDATIPPATLIDALFNKLAAEDHQLVLFDINRYTESEQLLRSDPEILTDRLLAKSKLPYHLTLLTNIDTSTHQVVAKNKPAGSLLKTEQPLDLAWPNHLFSLSHVALPFPSTDIIYGSRTNTKQEENVITLGSIWIRGERDLLEIPDNYFLRLRYNPFFPYMETRILEFLEPPDVQSGTANNPLTIINLIE